MTNKQIPWVPFALTSLSLQPQSLQTRQLGTGSRPSRSPGARSGDRDQGPGADGWVEGLERPAARASSPPFFPRSPPLAAPPREPRGFAPESPRRAGSSVPAHPHLPRRAASRKAKLVASKRKNGSSEGSRKLEKHLQGVLWALCAKPGRHSSGGNEDGHGRGEVGGRRSLARVRRAAGQVRRELDPSIVVTRRGHLQYERAILDW